VVPAFKQAGRLPTGVPVTALQAPALPMMLQASQLPLQAVLQQTPSTQKFDWHWFEAVQAEPGVSFGVHVLVAVQ
jgi:hypothetical protein